MRVVSRVTAGNAHLPGPSSYIGPTPPTRCMGQGCRRPATVDVLCEACDAYYRPRCPHCDRILKDTGVDRGMCSWAYAKSPEGRAEQRKLERARKARRKLAAAGRGR